MYGIGFLTALIISIVVFNVYAQTVLTTMTLTRGIYPNASTYTVFSESGVYYAKNSYGAMLSSYPSGSTNASLLIMAVLSTLGTNGGKIVLVGTIILTVEIPVNHNSVEITGENTGDDLYFVRDGVYHGVTTKAKTVVIAQGITAFHIGSSTFNQGISIKNLLIAGNSSDTALAYNVHTAGAGINITRGNTITIENVQVVGKEYGVYCYTGSFAWNKVIDVLTVNRLFLSFNDYGFYSEGAWIADASFYVIRGYANMRGLIHGDFQYDVSFNDVSSYNDNIEAVTVYDAPIMIETYRDIAFKHVVIAGDPHAPNTPLMFLSGGYISEWGIGAYIQISDIVLFGTNGTAIEVGGNGANIVINNIRAGSEGLTSFYGGYPDIKYYIVATYPMTDSNITVNGGYVSCDAVNKNTWFLGQNHTNQITVRNVDNWYMKGQLSYPFCTEFHSIGLVGNTTSFSASQDYVINGVDLLLTSSGGTGVSIEIKDAFGTTVASGLSTLSGYYLPCGYNIDFGGFSVAPTVNVFSANN
jgi:hypothetical protein